MTACASHTHSAEGDACGNVQPGTARTRPHIIIPSLSMIAPNSSRRVQGFVRNQIKWTLASPRNR